MLLRTYAIYRCMALNGGLWVRHIRVLIALPTLYKPCPVTHSVFGGQGRRLENIPSRHRLCTCQCHMSPKGGGRRETQGLLTPIFGILGGAIEYWQPKRSPGRGSIDTNQTLTRAQPQWAIWTLMAPHTTRADRGGQNSIDRYISSTWW